MWIKYRISTAFSREVYRNTHCLAVGTICFRFFPSHCWASSAHNSTVLLHQLRACSLALNFNSTISLATTGCSKFLPNTWCQLWGSCGASHRWFWAIAHRSRPAFKALCADAAIRHPGALSISNHQPCGSRALWHEPVLNLYVRLFHCFVGGTLLKIDN